MSRILKPLQLLANPGNLFSFFFLLPVTCTLIIFRKYFESNSVLYYIFKNMQRLLILSISD